MYHFSFFFYFRLLVEDKFLSFDCIDIFGHNFVSRGSVHDLISSGGDHLSEMVELVQKVVKKPISHVSLVLRQSKVSLRLTNKIYIYSLLSALKEVIKHLNKSLPVIKLSLF